MIKKLNYKDILIIFGTWYMIIGVNILTGQASFNYTPVFSGFLHFLFISAGRFIFLALFLFYHVSLYNISFKEVGLNFKRIYKIIIPVIVLVSVFFLLIILLINIPCSFDNLSGRFDPLYNITNPDKLIESIFPLIVIYPFSIIIALSELLILNCIIFELFNLKLNKIFSILFSAFFYSVLLLDFEPAQILINTLIALIGLYLYIKTERNLLMPLIFLAGYYSFYIMYIYGWEYIQF